MGIKRVKLNYRPIAKRKSDEIAYIVSKKHINALNKSIQNKINRNQIERIESSISAKDFHITSNSNNLSLVKKKKY